MLLLLLLLLLLGKAECRDLPRKLIHTRFGLLLKDILQLDFLLAQLADRTVASIS